MQDRWVRSLYEWSFLHCLQSKNEVVDLVLADENPMDRFVFAGTIDLDDGHERALLPQFNRLGLVVGGPSV